MSTPTITTSEILDALQRATRPAGAPPGLYTTRDIAAATGWSQDRVLDTLRPLVAAGTVRVEAFRSTDIRGRSITTHGYRFAKGRRAA